MRFIKKLFRKPPRRIPVIILHGKIMNDEESLNLLAKRAVIDAAFEAAKDIIYLSINSPGGLPGQSQLLHDYIRLQADKKGVRVISFIEDFGASGGYWLALAGDEIHCLDTSFVGSIGVISGSFGLQSVLENYKIERRLMTAGESKMRDDIFSEWTREDKDYKQALLENLHQTFKQQVLARRPDINQDVFDARVAIGKSALELGLVDTIGDMHRYTAEKFPKYECQYYTGKRMFSLNLRRRFGLLGLGDGVSPESAPLLKMR